ncbi:hypothetical protein [Pseudacidovorax sp. RU35E]|uniref:hypothetical protein n=1 Tax=Pseudacidovorax sp. RU35E TaxID=1907403 RepID=UPI001F4579A7|nr:hypothetical protein [Pseudacidovorax sp. RU35E]
MSTDAPDVVAPGRHVWEFARTGGVDQVLLRHGQDIARIGELDRKLWVALACPVQGLEFDSRTLALIDTNDDVRIRPPELIAACEWVCRELRDPQLLIAGGDTLSADDIAEASALQAECRRILRIVGKDEGAALTLDDVTGRSELLASLRFNGDGVITPATAQDEAISAVIDDIIRTQDGVMDRSGTKGIQRAQAEAFFAQAHALMDWQAKAVSDDATMPLGEATLAAAAALDAVEAKVDDFFARCNVAAFDPQAVPALNPAAAAYDVLAGSAIDTHSPALAALPLAPVAPGRTLPMAGRVNPAWADALAKLRERAVAPLLGTALEAIDEGQWALLRERLAACRRWLASRPPTRLGNAADTPPERLQAWLAAEAAVLDLLARDEAEEAHNKRLVDLERLLRFKRDLYRLLRNFVSFEDFYARRGAIFQAGRLYLDGRSCDLVVRVADAKKHAMLAGLAKTCLAYCECTRGKDKMTIVAAFTAGDTDFLFVGRNGVFYDREGRDWDATITQMIENPTSVAQAFVAPYKKFIRLVEEQVAKRAAASEATAQASLSSVATTVATADKAVPPATAGQPAASPKLPGRIDVGTVAALGVAMGSISAVLVAMFTKFVDLGPWIPIALVGMVVAISGPSMLIAWIKLRQRSLGPILDASGWAINGRMKVSVRLGGSLSRMAKLPHGAKRVLKDPYADRSSGWLVGLGVLLVVGAATVWAWRSGWQEAHLPQPAQPAINAPAVGAPALTPNR